MHKTNCMKAQNPSTFRINVSQIIFADIFSNLNLSDADIENLRNPEFISLNYTDLSDEIKNKLPKKIEILSVETNADNLPTEIKVSVKSSSKIQIKTITL